VDYDSQRHNYQSLQGNPKKRDEIKVTKARESLEEAKRTYELLNSELHDELPALHDSRVLFLVTNLQTLFAAEQVFHAETAKVKSPVLNKLFIFTLAAHLHSFKPSSCYIKSHTCLINCYMFMAQLVQHCIFVIFVLLLLSQSLFNTLIVHIYNYLTGNWCS